MRQYLCIGVKHSLITLAVAEVSQVLAYQVGTSYAAVCASAYSNASGSDSLCRPFRRQARWFCSLKRQPQHLLYFTDATTAPYVGGTHCKGAPTALACQLPSPSTPLIHLSSFPSKMAERTVTPVYILSSAATQLHFKSLALRHSSVLAHISRGWCRKAQYRLACLGPGHAATMSRLKLPRQLHLAKKDG